MRFKLRFDEALSDVPGQKIEAYARMARYGSWREDGWWKPPRYLSREDALRRIEREGFIVEEETDDGSGTAKED